MTRLYYLTRSLPELTRISQELRAAGIGNNRIQVLSSHDRQELDHLHTTTLWENTEIMHSGFVGALIGFSCGLIAGFCLEAIPLLGRHFTLLEILLVSSLLFACLGAWLGGLRGLSLENHHLAPFMDRVRQGEYLMVVEVDSHAMELWVRSLIEHHGGVIEAGYPAHFSPFF